MTMPLAELATALQCTLFPVQILLVDDDPSARSAFQRVLERQGYSVIAAADARDALQLLEETHVPVDVLVTDVQMPGMLGDALAMEVRRAWPDLPVLFVSGEEAFQRLAGEAGGRARFLLKPFGPDELAEGVAALLRPLGPADAR
ncbi:MAG: response regulator [Gemmatimonadales bacterium]